MSTNPAGGQQSSPFVGMQQRPLSPVARRQSAWPMILAVCGLALLAVLVFSALSSSRTSPPKPTVGAVGSVVPAPGRNLSAILGTPGAVMMPALATQPGIAGTSAMPPATLVPGNPAPGSTPAITESQRYGAPSVVIDLASASEPSTRATADKALPGAAGDRGESNEERFAARLASSTVETSTPRALRDRALVAPQGTIIPAVMETAINSDLPGFARALVSRDVRGFDGTTVVIPRGTHLIGQYRNALAIGQSRAFVVWSRLITPEGLSIDIQSPGSDRLGRSGLEGETHSHFFRRFGNAILLSVLNAGLQGLATRGGNDTSIVIGSSQQASSIATLALQREIDIPPTVTVPQGSAINVFIARDLDFSQVAAPRRR
ncbi:MAG: hypothetical protein RIS94_3095 [Pseudomonadota bacterium]|jgi:type IV secretion system protein VirB10